MASCIEACFFIIQILALVSSGYAVTVHGDGIDYLGVQNETSGINTFWGIRYAQAPVDDLRWRAPVPVQQASQKGLATINATAPGPACIQSDPTWSGSTSNLIQDEDCLLLNVQIPAKPKSPQLPVLVFIHGGGYVTGDAATTSGDSLVYQSDGSMVYVAIQYRLGPLGFLAGQSVKEDGTPNAGLLDQRVALEWIRKHIHIFGGDPSKITITGSSAGGGSVTMQMIMFGGEEDPPFRAAIPEFPWWTPIYNDTWVDNQYTGLLEATNCSTLSCLRGLPISEFQNATRRSYEFAYIAKQYAYGIFYWGPVVDGDTIRHHPFEEFRRGHFTKVPILTDHNGDEGAMFTNFLLSTKEELLSDLSTLWQDTESYFTDIVVSLYPDSIYNRRHLEEVPTLQILPPALGLNLSSLSNVFFQREAAFGDALVNCPTRYVAKAVAEAGHAVHKAIFNAGFQFHGATATYLFSNEINTDGAFQFQGVTVPGNATLASILRSYFISFTLHLDPNSNSSAVVQPPIWPQYGSTNPEILYIGFAEIYPRSDPQLTKQCQFLEMGRGNNRGIWPQW